VGRTPTWRHPPGFVEWLGAKLAIGVLAAIGVMVMGFVGAWWYTLPTFKLPHRQHLFDCRQLLPRLALGFPPLNLHRVDLEPIRITHDPPTAACK
jgi:hypothetical protein